MPASIRPEKSSEWWQQVASWLYDTSHVTMRYSVTYDGVALEHLSPGTRGIVLLLLYLVIDKYDVRPLIIDQPEENLDPKSVFEELVPHFREARRRRQVVIVTHNPTSSSTRMPTKSSSPRRSDDQKSGCHRSATRAAHWKIRRSGTRSATSSKAASEHSWTASVAIVCTGTALSKNNLTLLRRHREIPHQRLAPSNARTSHLLGGYRIRFRMDTKWDESSVNCDNSRPPTGRTAIPERPIRQRLASNTPKTERSATEPTVASPSDRLPLLHSASRVQSDSPRRGSLNMPDWVGDADPSSLHASALS